MAIYMIARLSLTVWKYRYATTVCVADVYNHIIVFVTFIVTCITKTAVVNSTLKEGLQNATTQHNCNEKCHKRMVDTGINWSVVDTQRHKLYAFWHIQNEQLAVNDVHYQVRVKPACETHWSVCATVS